MNANKLKIYDLDGTVIDSDKRLAAACGGSVNMARFDVGLYRKMQTWEHIRRDSLLPLANTMRRHIGTGYTVAIVTARELMAADWRYLEQYGLIPNDKGLIFHRGNHHAPEVQHNGQYKRDILRDLKSLGHDSCTMFEDDKHVLAECAALGIKAYDAVQLNQKLRAL